MSSYLAIDETLLEAKNSLWTAKEIMQQPDCWRATLSIVKAARVQLDSWLVGILDKQNAQIIFTGAGTSAYVGEAVVGYLNQQLDITCRSVSSTELVACPEQYLQPNKPTLLVSFARSGNSPESVAAVEVVNNYVKECAHLLITCNPDGALHQQAAQDENYFSLLMPVQTLDHSFAMTSSFTSMLVASVAIFSDADNAVLTITEAVEKNIAGKLAELKALAELPMHRLVYLGAGSLKGYAQESALKLLELSAGQVMGYFESPLGFRHGPKSLVDDKTLIVLFGSTNTYTKQYDIDLLNELRSDNQAIDVHSLALPDNAMRQQLDDVFNGLYYMVCAQIISFYKAWQLGITVDNPCPTGEVNRVVQGVTIYPLKQGDIND
ncbi:SIS domain-containing protein [Pseudoalteromonas arctica]|uniref:SIS domain-containing protein n=1 Tax=Pseudoalteromonas arctica TaxID=394751 RepID=A0A7Y0DS80_9GAMM|nr:SIS domain-containing protein [Pseudoalteromonas arctica]NMM40634.1 SIS domain-containing protein [Pseudoalteromonas arctica]